MNKHFSFVLSATTFLLFLVTTAPIVVVGAKTTTSATAGEEKGDDPTCNAGNDNEALLSSPPPAARALDIATGNWKAQSIRSFVSTGLAAAMESLCGPENHFVSANDIAKKASLHPKATYRLLRFLSTFDVCVQGDGETCKEVKNDDNDDPKTFFKLGPIGQVLTPNHPESVANAILWEASPESAALWNLLPLFLTTNQHVVSEGWGTETFWDYMTQEAPVLSMFQKAMTGYSNDEAFFMTNPELTPTLDLNKFDTVCDLGSAEGRLAIALSKRFSHPKYILSDLPEAMDRIDDSTLPHNFSKQPTNFLESVPKADAYILKHILHDWDDEPVIRILQNIQRANNQATVFVAEFGPQPGPNVPHLAKGFDVHMGLFFTGAQRTQEEFNALYKKVVGMGGRTMQVKEIHLLAGGNFPMYIQEVVVGNPSTASSA